MDAFWSIVAADGDHERGLAPYLRSVRDTWGISDHFWLVRGYEATRFGFWPVEGGGAYRGPIRALGATVPPLVIAVRHDPATPYRWGQRLARDLDARLLTVHGDGHSAARNPCVLQLMKRYLDELEVPAPGVTCKQPSPFPAGVTRRRSAGRSPDPARRSA
jgi:pimeloyl-ACP methyl ester carboxylesterase